MLLPEERAAEAADLSALLGAAGSVEIVAGADGLFRAGLPGLGRAAIAWIRGRG